MASIPYSAIILTGGRGSRLGQLRKDQIRVAGTSLYDTAVHATADAAARIVVGPPPKTSMPNNPPHVWEEPHYGGPAAAIAAGWDHLRRNHTEVASPVLILATDLPSLPELVSALLLAWRTAPPGTELVLPKDLNGKDQNAAVAISAAGLERFWDNHQPKPGELKLGEPNPLVNAPLRKVFAEIQPEQRYQPVFEPNMLQDIDTPEDAAAVDAELPGAKIEE